MEKTVTNTLRTPKEKVRIKVTGTKDAIDGYTELMDALFKSRGAAQGKIKN